MPEAVRGNSWWQPRDLAPSDGIVVAVDLGTYGTGIAYKAQGRSDEDISYFTKWPGNPDVTYPKTLTAILYEKGRPINFGWEARIAYQLLEDHERTKRGYTYLDGFKLALDTGSRSKALPKGFTPVQVISDFLRLFTEHCLTKLRRDYPKGSVKWCLTVPAIWKDDQKDAMREAAWKAGMIPNKHSEQLCIILEPEAALLHASARNLELDAMATGSTVMVVDAGGGTVDLTVHTIQRDGGGQLALAEAAPGDGGFCGATYVDGNFEKWFRDQIGHGTFDAWKRQCYAEYMRVMVRWEEEKHDFDPRGASPTRGAAAAYINLPPQLQQVLDNGVRSKIAEESGDQRKLAVSQQRMVGFFKPQIDAVVALVRKLARSCPGRKVDKMLLAGGFANSHYFVTCLMEQLAGVCSPVNIVVLDRPDTVIVRGAAAYASSCTLIASRCVRLAYGIQHFRVSKWSDPSAAKEWTSGRTNCFERLVSAGDSVKIGETITVSRQPWNDSQGTLCLQLYSTTDNKDEFIRSDDPKMTLVAELKIADIVKGEELDVSLVFGQQELTMSAYSPTRNKKYAVNATFACYSFR